MGCDFYGGWKIWKSQNRTWFRHSPIFFKIPAQKRFFDLLLITGIWDVSCLRIAPEISTEANLALPGVCLYHRHCVSARGGEIPSQSSSWCLSAVSLSPSPAQAPDVSQNCGGQQGGAEVLLFLPIQRQKFKQLASLQGEKRGSRKCRCWLKSPFLCITFTWKKTVLFILGEGCFKITWLSDIIHKHSVSLMNLLNCSRLTPIC